MGRKRKHNKHLPQRWDYKHGAYYYRVPPGSEEHWDGKQTFRLGKTEPEAYRTFAARVDQQKNASTMSALFERYLLEHTPTCRPKTQAHQKRSIAKLIEVFGEVTPTAFESHWAFKYYDLRSKDGVSAANQDIKTLSHVFTKAIEWGIIENSAHPLRGLRIKKSDAVRDRYVTDAELAEALTVADDFIRLYVAFKLMTGMDKSTILSIRLTDISEDGIKAARIKTKAKVRIYEMTAELAECIKQIKALPGPVSSIWLFCNRKGQSYISESGYTSGFDSKWKRFMKKALDTTGLEERFTEHDLRAKAASDSDSLEFAQSLLGHADSRITAKVYRRRPEVVKTRKLKGD